MRTEIGRSMAGSVVVGKACRLLAVRALVTAFVAATPFAASAAPSASYSRIQLNATVTEGEGGLSGSFDLQIADGYYTLGQALTAGSPTPYAEAEVESLRANGGARANLIYAVEYQKVDPTAPTIPLPVTLRSQGEAYVSGYVPGGAGTGGAGISVYIYEQSSGVTYVNQSARTTTTDLRKSIDITRPITVYGRALFDIRLEASAGANASDSVIGASAFIDPSFTVDEDAWAANLASYNLPYSDWRNYYNAAASPGMNISAPIPEPSLLGVGAISGVGLLVRRSRRG